MARDFEKLRASGITIFHPAVGFTGPDVYACSLRDITGWNEFIRSHAGEFLRIDCPGDTRRAKASGRLCIVIGQQNSRHFRTVDDVDRFYDLGQRVSQLTYDDNQIGGGSSDPRDLGLTAYGVQIVERMNKTGMAVDISHCSDRTTLDALHASRKPVLVTHSNCRALVPAARCKTDEAIRLLAAQGGVMGITMVRGFVQASGPATIEDVLDHIDHVVKLVGVEHVGIGSDVDLDGRDRRIHPKSRLATKRFDLDGIDYSQKIFDLTEGLIRRKYSAENIALILVEISSARSTPSVRPNRRRPREARDHPAGHRPGHTRLRPRPIRDSCLRVRDPETRPVYSGATPELLGDRLQGIRWHASADQRSASHDVRTDGRYHRSHLSGFHAAQRGTSRPGFRICRLASPAAFLCAGVLGIAARGWISCGVLFRTPTIHRRHSSC